ncbi:MAG TPA: fatty acid desaturase [Candidatus Baltobacteraceae bacterium]|nr:fatty acid desaturase [Candidatus Baltobacteraceae bacterium]
MHHRPNWVTGIALLAIHVGALLAFVPAFFSWWALLAAGVVAYATGGIGITLCFHRALTHRALRMVKPLEYATAILGTLAFQGSPIDWVATHRIHHAHSDRAGDPHSIRRGLSWAHLTWLFRTNENIPTGAQQKRVTPDLWGDPFYRALRYLHIPLQIALAGLLLLLGGWSWVIWAIFVRLVFTYHATWLVNSAAHFTGYRTYRTMDRSVNSWWVALISWGEGWHNNHHAFPFSARHGLKWFELDCTWWMIKVMAAMRLVDKVRVPTREMRERLAAAQEEIQRRYFRRMMRT